MAAVEIPKQCPAACGGPDISCSPWDPANTRWPSGTLSLRQSTWPSERFSQKDRFCLPDHSPASPSRRYTLKNHKDSLQWAYKQQLALVCFGMLGPPWTLHIIYRKVRDSIVHLSQSFDGSSLWSASTDGTSLTSACGIWGKKIRPMWSQKGTGRRNLPKKDGRSQDPGRKW